MSNPALEWSPAEARPSAALAMVPVVRHELKRHAVLYTGIFAALALVALGVGLLLPKKYASTTTILVEESNIIAPLMEGRAVPTSGSAATRKKARVSGLASGPTTWCRSESAAVAIPHTDATRQEIT